MQEIALMILKASNVRLSYSESVKNSIKNTILNNKLFQEHVAINNNQGEES